MLVVISCVGFSLALFTFVCRFFLKINTVDEFTLWAIDFYRRRVINNAIMPPPLPVSFWFDMLTATLLAFSILFASVIALGELCGFLGSQIGQSFIDVAKPPIRYLSDYGLELSRPLFATATDFQNAPSEERLRLVLKDLFVIGGNVSLYLLVIGPIAYVAGITIKFSIQFTDDIIGKIISHDFASFAVRQIVWRIIFGSLICSAAYALLEILGELGSSGGAPHPDAAVNFVGIAFIILTLHSFFDALKDKLREYLPLPEKNDPSS